MLSSQSRPGRDHGTLRETLGSPILKSVIAVVLLAVVAVGGWMAYTAQSRPALPPRATATPALSPMPSAGQVAEGGVAPAVLPSPAAASPSASPAGGAVSPAITPIPATPPAPKIAEKATPAPAPKSTETPAPAPAVAAKPTPAARPAGGGYEALKAGRLADAAAGFETVAQSRSADFSVQLLVACSPQTIEKAIQNDSSPELFILPATIAGKPCHRLMRGFFKTNAEATQAVASLPGYYVAEGAKPKAVQVKSVLR